MKKILFLILWIGISIVNAQNNHVTIVQYQDSQYDILDAATICPAGVKVIASGVGIPTSVGIIINGRWTEDRRSSSDNNDFYNKEEIIRAIQNPQKITETPDRIGKLSHESLFTILQLSKWKETQKFYYLKHNSRRNKIDIIYKIQSEVVYYYWPIYLMFILSILVIIWSHKQGQSDRRWRADKAHQQSSYIWILLRQFGTILSSLRFIGSIVMIILMRYMGGIGYLFMYFFLLLELGIFLYRYYTIKISKYGYKWNGGSSILFQYLENHQSVLNKPKEVLEIVDWNEMYFFGKTWCDASSFFMSQKIPNNRDSLLFCY